MDENNVLKRFRDKKVLTIAQLVEFLECSVITVRRCLKKWKTYTSFNKNGRYYTLPEIPEFDKNGKWKYQTILFSKYGNLKQTIIQLVKQSKAGLSAKEITEIIELRSNSSFLSQLQNFPGIRREKHQGRFVYFSDEPEIYDEQKQKCTLYRQGAIRFPSDADAVVILVQFIKHPNISIEELCDRVAQQGKKIDSCVIESFLEYHDLLKKIPDTKP
jgi:hypothetical protein